MVVETLVKSATGWIQQPQQWWQATAAAAVDDDPGTGDPGDGGDPGAGDPGAGDPGTAAKGTVAGSDPAGDAVKPVAVPATWPDNWRELMAGKDEELLKSVKRYQSPVNLAKALREAQKKISSGTLVQPLADNASDEEKVAWRAANGIPESWEKYDDQIKPGLVWGDDDRPLVDSFKKHAHENNLPPNFVKQGLTWYSKMQEEAQQELFNSDKQDAETVGDSLRSEWGMEYRANLNAMRGFFDTGGEGLFDAVMGARGPDGKLVGNSPAVMQFFVKIAKELNPGATIIPGDTTTSMAGIEEEIASIEKLMRTNRPEYDKDVPKQKRYLQLLEARERLGKR